MQSFDIRPLTLSAPRTETPADAQVFTPEGVCAKLIQFVVEDGRLAHVQFTGGCDGNLKAVAILTKDMKVAEIIERLSGITCGRKPTSCADQLCRALAPYLTEPADKC